MTSRPIACDTHFQPKRILIAIRAQLDHALQIARRLALLPERGPRTGPVMRNPCFQGEAQRFLVHMGDHQQFAVTRIGYDGGDET